MAGNLGKPTKPRWADGLPAYTAEPSLAKRILGWLSQEKPPFQWMNWLFLKNKEWHDFKERFLDIDQSLMMRSDAAITWTGTQIEFTQDLELIFKVGGDIWTNTIALADSPLALADGDVVVLIKDDANTALALEAVYANIGVGEYCIEPEVNLTENTDEHELILFRRRGTVLEIPMQRRSINTGAIFELDLSDFAAGGIMPIGSYLIFDDFNGTLPLPSTTPYWWPCDGTAVNSATSLLHGINTKDVTGRYLVGFTTGVEGDASINAAGAMGIVGNALHQIDIQHLHTVDLHGHPDGTLALVNAAIGGSTANEATPRHTHTGAAHRHKMGVISPASTVIWGDVASAQTITHVASSTSGGTGTDATQASSAVGDVDTFSGGAVATGEATAHLHAAGTLAITDATISGTTANANPGTNNQLSATQSIQPRSVEVRCYVRIL